MRTGSGIPFSHYGEDFVAGIHKGNSPAIKTLLVKKWLPNIPGIVEKLQNGIKVADVGCGSGAASLSMAKG